MIVYRLSKDIYANELSGVGAAKCGGRWNSIGVELIYTAENRFLTLAELVVHLSIIMLPKSYKMITINIPDDIKVLTYNSDDLPFNWNKFPYNQSTQRIGNIFISENKFCLLKVPSAVSNGDYNYLINPNHKDFHLISIENIEEFPLDNRLFRVF